MRLFKLHAHILIVLYKNEGKKITDICMKVSKIYKSCSFNNYYKAIYELEEMGLLKIKRSGREAHVFLANEKAREIAKMLYKVNKALS